MSDDEPTSMSSLHATTSSSKPRKRQFRWNLEKDIIFLQECLVEAPFLADHGKTMDAWTSTVDAFNKTSDVKKWGTVTVQTAKLRFTKLCAMKIDRPAAEDDAEGDIDADGQRQESKSAVIQKYYKLTLSLFVHVQGSI